MLAFYSPIAFADNPRFDCFPVSKQLHSQVLRTPMNEGGVLVVVEETTCDDTHPPTPLQVAPVVPVELRRVLTPSQLADARAAGRALVPLGPEAFHETIDGVVQSVRGHSKGRSVQVVHEEGLVQVVAGDAAFLGTKVDVRPEACAWAASIPWTVHTAQYCILDQVGEDTFFPEQAFPGWAGGIPNQVQDLGVPLLDALIDIYTVNGVQPYGFFFFFSEPGEPDGLPRRRVTLEVHYPTFPDGSDPEHTIRPRKPGAPRKVFREIPGDTDEPHNPVPKVKAKPPEPSK